MSDGRVLVTGTAGEATVKWLLRMGADVDSLARKPPANLLASVTYRQGDIRDAGAVREAMLEPGEILVAHATDTGWTPFFGVAAGVVNVDHAIRRLQDGRLAEVDGATGTVTVIAEVN